MTSDGPDEVLGPAGLRRLRAVVADRTDVLLTLHRPDGEVVYAAGPALDALAGVDPATIKGRNVFRYYHGDDVDRMRRSFRQVVEDNATVDVTYRFRHGGGSWVRLRSIAWADAPGPDDVLIVAVTVPAEENGG